MAAGFARQTLIFACVFVVRLLSEHEVLSAKKWKRTDGGGCASVSFDRNVFHFLNATNVGSHLVQKVGICAHMCVDNFLCFSYNIAAQTDINNHFLCELLASDMYNSSDQFLPHPDFHHYSMKVSYLFDSSHHDIPESSQQFWQTDKDLFPCTVPLIRKIHWKPARSENRPLLLITRVIIQHQNAWRFKLI